MRTKTEAFAAAPLLLNKDMLFPRPAIAEAGQRAFQDDRRVACHPQKCRKSGAARRCAEQWGQAHAESGGEPEVAHAMAARTAAFFTGE